MSSHSSAGATIRGVVVNESGFIREGLCRVLERFPQVDVVASVPCPHLLDAITAALPVDVALIDAQFPSQTSVEVIKRLRNVGLDTRVVIISVNPSVDEVKRVFQSGAHGFLLREAGVDELEVALHAAAKEEMFLYPTILKRLFGRPDVGTLSHRTSDRQTLHKPLMRSTTCLKKRCAWASWNRNDNQGFCLYCFAGQ